MRKEDKQLNIAASREISEKISDRIIMNRCVCEKSEGHRRMEKTSQVTVTTRCEKH